MGDRRVNGLAQEGARMYTCRESVRIDGRGVGSVQRESVRNDGIGVDKDKDDGRCMPGTGG